MQKAICVFSASSGQIPPVYFQCAEDLAQLMAQKNYTLVFGGGNIGLMGIMTKTMHQHGGKVIGVIPELFHLKGYSYLQSDELIVTRDMRMRKTIMEQRSDAFIALPGGFGTLEEILEILTLKQLKYHSKPLVIINTNGFYDPLLNLFERMYEQQFTKASYKNLYTVVPDAPAAISAVEEQLSSNREPQDRD